MIKLRMKWQSCSTKPDVICRVQTSTFDNHYIRMQKKERNKEDTTSKVPVYVYFQPYAPRVRVYERVCVCVRVQPMRSAGWLMPDVTIVCVRSHVHTGVVTTHVHGCTCDDTRTRVYVWWHTSTHICGPRWYSILLVRL